MTDAMVNRTITVMKMLNLELEVAELTQISFSTTNPELSIFRKIRLSLQNTLLRPV